MTGTITVLTSGVALGVHVPGLLLVRRLREAGVAAEVDVLERLLPPASRGRIPASKAAFHRDFRVALAGQRWARNLAPQLDGSLVDGLFARWRAEERRRFVVLSGFWVPVLDRYAERSEAEAGVELDVDLCHVDSVASPSFELCPPRDRDGGGPYRHVWLLDAQSGTVPQTIPVTHDPPVPWSQRSARYLAHGGGWGMGTYAERARELIARGLAIDVVAYEAADIPQGGHLDADADADAQVTGRWFMLDPDWHPWDDDGFPPFGEVGRDGGVRFHRSPARHGSFDLARGSLAMISKPGGGTLMDSLAAATPVVLLEPFGDHEARNAELWCRLGFGLPYDDWCRARCSADALERLHENLLAVRAQVPSYAASLAEEALASGRAGGP